MYIMGVTVEELANRIESLERKVQTLEYSIGTVESILLELIEESDPLPDEAELMRSKRSDDEYIPLYRLKGETNAGE